MIQAWRGLTLSAVERLTGRHWLPFSAEDSYEGPGAYIWVSDEGHGEVVYVGKSVRVLARISAEAGWALGGDVLGEVACMRLIVRYSARAYYLPTERDSEARDVEALVAAASVHVAGHPPLAWGLAWLPRSRRQQAAWDLALEWAEREGSVNEEVA